MLEILILTILSILVLFLFLIYKKLDNRKENQDELKKELGIEREVKLGFAGLKESYKNDQNVLKDKITSDLGKLNERLGIIDAAQKELSELKTNVIDFKNLFNNKTERGQLGEEFLENYDNEELADLLQIIYSLIEISGCKLEDIEEIMDKKQAVRGSFTKGIILKKVD